MTGAVKPFSVEKAYEKDPNISPDDIRKLREWLKTQPHLPGKHIIDQELILAYHSCSYSAEVTKQLLDLHYTLRTLFTNMYINRDAENVKTGLLSFLFAILPTPSVFGHRVAYLRILDPDPCKYIFQETVKILNMTLELTLIEGGTWPGLSLIIDMAESTLAHVGRIDISSLKESLYFLQECVFVKIKEIHFLNAPYFMDKVLMLAKPFLKKHVLRIIHIHYAGSETIYEYVPKKAFPREEGGEYKDHITIRDELIEKLKNNRQYFEEESQRRVNESLRPGGKSKVADIFSIQGSFKKLDID